MHFLFFQIQDNYDFGCNEGHNQGGTFWFENGDAYGHKYGTYQFKNNKGLIRIVNYITDENRFPAEPKSTEEPGVDEKKPSSVIIFKKDTPTLLPYPGQQSASISDANEIILGFTVAAASVHQ